MNTEPNNSKNTLKYDRFSIEQYTDLHVNAVINLV